MREVYRGNGFVIRTNDSGELFLSRSDNASPPLRISSNRDNEIVVSYLNTGITMMPLAYQTITFKTS